MWSISEGRGIGNERERLFIETTSLITSKTKKRDNSTESPRLVSLLNGFQVVRMVELLGLLGSLEYIREEGGLGMNERGCSLKPLH